jgi:hypothetical protein
MAPPKTRTYALLPEIHQMLVSFGSVPHAMRVLQLGKIPVPFMGDTGAMAGPPISGRTLSLILSHNALPTQAERLVLTLAADSYAEALTAGEITHHMTLPEVPSAQWGVLPDARVELLQRTALSMYEQIADS